MQRWRWYCCLPAVAVPLGPNGAGRMQLQSPLFRSVEYTACPASCCVRPQLQWPVALHHDDIRNEQRHLLAAHAPVRWIDGWAAELCVCMQLFADLIAVGLSGSVRLLFACPLVPQDDGTELACRSLKASNLIHFRYRATQMQRARLVCAHDDHCSRCYRPQVHRACLSARHPTFLCVMRKCAKY
jgi:hypothetical protein